MRILLQNSSSDRKLYHGINLYVVEYLGDVVVGVLTYYFLQIANAVGIYNGLALELGAHFEAYSNALLRNHTAEAQTQIRAEVLHLYATVHVTVLVNGNVVFADFDAGILTLSHKCGKFVAVTGNLYELVAAERQSGCYEERA